MSFGGGSKSDYGAEKANKEMAEAAKLNAETAARAQEWSEQFFENYVAPILKVNTDLAITNEERAAKLFDFQFDQAQLQDTRYREFGIPAEDRFYRMAEEYSEPGYAEREAALAMGDVRAAQANQNQQLMRALASRGVDPTSPAAIAAMTDSAVLGSMMQATAANRARAAARDLGMALTADAANFARGALSGGLSYSQAAGGSAMQGQSATQGAVGAASGAGQIPMQGFNTAAGAYGANMSAWASMANTARQLQAKADESNSSGFGSFVGTIIGSGLKHSDRRLKKNVVKVGTLPNGLNVYEFDYIWGGPRQRGVLADEVEKIIPAAVSERLGFKMVDYSMLVGV